MTHANSIYKFQPCAYGTKLIFSGAEEGGWVIEVDATAAGEREKRRIKLSFSGVVKARINDDADRVQRTGYLVTEITDSAWLKEDEAAYISKFGTKLLVVLKDIKHFVIVGHDISIGLLARYVTCEIL